MSKKLIIGNMGEGGSLWKLVGGVLTPAIPGIVSIGDLTIAGEIIASPSGGMTLAVAGGNTFALLNGSVGIGTDVPETLLEMQGLSSDLTLHNLTQEDIDGGRESQINFKGEQSGGEETTLARIEVSHEGVGDDEKGSFAIFTNDGNDGDTPIKKLNIDSIGDMTLETGDLYLGIGSLYMKNGESVWINRDSGSTPISVLSMASGTDDVMMTITDKISWQNTGLSEKMKLTGGGTFFVTDLWGNGDATPGRDVYVQSTGELTYNSSSRESKINIIDIVNWGNIYELTPIQFNSRKKVDNQFTEEYFPEKHFGLIADDVEAFFPEVVWRDDVKDDEDKIVGSKVVGMDYKALITPIIKCIQDLNARLKILEG